MCRTVESMLREDSFDRLRVDPGQLFQEREAAAHEIRKCHHKLVDREDVFTNLEQTL